jgi:hypothetical protein
MRWRLTDALAARERVASQASPRSPRTQGPVVAPREVRMNDFLGTLPSRSLGSSTPRSARSQCATAARSDIYVNNIRNRTLGRAVIILPGRARLYGVPDCTSESFTMIRRAVSKLPRHEGDERVASAMRIR